MDKIYESFDLGRIKMYVSQDHRFGTDAFLLARYANVHRGNVVCDLCTGCGIIPLILCKDTPPAKIYAVDIQEEAIGLLEKSVSENGLCGTILPVLCDLKQLTQDKIPFECADIVTVNPPYMTGGSGAERISRAQAIARHELMCNINDVCGAAARVLKYGGLLKMCQRPERLCDVICAMRESGIEPKSVTFVHKTARDKPWLFLISGKRGASPGMIIERPMILQNEDLSYTEDYTRLYE